MACKAYSVATIWLREGVPWTRTLRELASHGKITAKDEINRRIVVEVPLVNIGRVVELISRVASAEVFEVKVSCRGDKDLPSEGRWRIISRKPRLVAYGIIRGRYVFAEKIRGSTIFKLGRRSRATIPPSILPASAFQFSGKELLGIIEELNRLVEMLSR